MSKFIKMMMKSLKYTRLYRLTMRLKLKLTQIIWK